MPCSVFPVLCSFAVGHVDLVQGSARKLCLEKRGPGKYVCTEWQPGEITASTGWLGIHIRQ